MKRPIVSALLAVSVIAAPSAGAGETAVSVGANPMIHAQGTRLVDGTGAPVVLRGVLLEGWLMWNGTLFGAGLSSESRIAERLQRLVGPEEFERFRTAIYDHFITERDIERIAELGFNVVRVPFNHTVLERDGRPDATAVGWGYLDRLLEWCELHSVYAVLDLHAVPGGQSGIFVSDPDRIQVWKSEENLQRTVDLWTAIATRYRDRTIVAGYDLINEPEPPSGAELVALYRRIITAIRAVDSHHLVFLEGGGPAASDFTFYDGPLDSNQAYSFHAYNLFSDAIDREYFTKLAAMARSHNVPLWNGEFGAHTDDWVQQHVNLFEDPAYRVNGWVFWPWKRVPRSLLGEQALPAAARDRDHRGLGHTPQVRGLDLRSEEDRS